MDCSFKLKNLKHIINGIPIENILKENNWYRFNNTTINIVEKILPATKKRVGFILKFPELAKPEILLRLSLEDVQEYYDDLDEVQKWKYFEEYRSLYITEHEDMPQTKENVEFKINVLGTLDISSFNKPEEMKVSYKEFNDMWSNNNTPKKVDVSSIVQYSDIERMLTPEFMLWTRPCELTSKQVYSIVRAYILEIMILEHVLLILITIFVFCKKDY